MCFACHYIHHFIYHCCGQLLHKLAPETNSLFSCHSCLTPGYLVFKKLQKIASETQLLNCGVLQMFLHRLCSTGELGDRPQLVGVNSVLSLLHLLASNRAGFSPPDTKELGLMVTRPAYPYNRIIHVLSLKKVIPKSENFIKGFVFTALGKVPIN